MCVWTHVCIAATTHSVSLIILLRICERVCVCVCPTTTKHDGDPRTLRRVIDDQDMVWVDATYFCSIFIQTLHVPFLSKVDLSGGSSSKKVHSTNPIESFVLIREEPDATPVRPSDNSGDASMFIGTTNVVSGWYNNSHELSSTTTGSSHRYDTPTTTIATGG